MAIGLLQFGRINAGQYITALPHRKPEQNFHGAIRPDRGAGLSPERRCCRSDGAKRSGGKKVPAMQHVRNSLVLSGSERCRQANPD